MVISGRHKQPLASLRRPGRAPAAGRHGEGQEGPRSGRTPSRRPGPRFTAYPGREDSGHENRYGRNLLSIGESGRGVADISIARRRGDKVEIFLDCLRHAKLGDGTAGIHDTLPEAVAREMLV